MILKIKLFSVVDKNGREVKKRTVLVMARSIPGESPASYVVQGLMDFLVSKHKIAQELRDKLIFKVIPMMNPDGVYLGNYRGNLLGKLFTTLSLTKIILHTVRAFKPRVSLAYKCFDFIKFSKQKSHLFFFVENQ